MEVRENLANALAEIRNGVAYSRRTFRASFMAGSARPREIRKTALRKGEHGKERALSLSRRCDHVKKTGFPLHVPRQNESSVSQVPRVGLRHFSYFSFAFGECHDGGSYQLSSRFGKKGSLDNFVPAVQLSGTDMAELQNETVSEAFAVVLVGSFNPAILHPEWFVRNKLVGESALSSATVNVIASDVAEFNLINVVVFCDKERLHFTVGNMAYVDALLDLVKGTLQLLSHLPVTAVGLNNNALYRVDSEDHWHRIGHALAPKEQVWDRLCKKPGLTNLSINSPVDWDFPLQENLTLAPVLNNLQLHPAIKIQTNLHLTVPDMKTAGLDLTPTAVALRFIETRWQNAASRAKEVAAEIFKQIP